MISSHTVSIYTGPCQRATTQEECETFARQLGLTDTTAPVINDLERPPYCYYKPLNSIGDRRLFFNTAMTENSTPCTGIRQCVCKNSLQTSGKIKQELISSHFTWKLVDENCCSSVDRVMCAKNLCTSL